MTALVAPAVLPGVQTDEKDVADKASWTVAVDAKWNAAELRAIVFAQDPATWRVFEAAQTAVPAK